MNITQAMVLAAGKGTRLRPLTDVLPKPLAEVAGVPLIRLALRQLRAAGVTRAVVNLFHLGGAIEAALGQEAEGVALVYSTEEAILGTGGGIRRALRWLGTKPFFVVNADALQDVDLPALARAHHHSGAWATLALREDPDVLLHGPVGVDGSGRIRRLVNAFDDGGATHLRMFTGVHLMDHRSVDHLPDGQESCIIRQGYAHLLRQGAPLHSHLHAGAFHDVGTPERWHHAQHQVMDGAHPGVSRRVGAVDRDPVFLLSPRAQVHPTARLTPPVAIQDGAVVGADAVVGPHVALGRGAVVGARAVLEDAAVLAGVGVEQGETVRGQVRGPGVRLGWPHNVG